MYMQPGGIQLPMQIIPSTTGYNASIRHGVIQFRRPV